ncbi:helix-turn-helix domain-containing protein [Octadecabacter sp. R77987]|uniref:helix-turn-helix domain-containing protein n=1 Tax=Octadecabacter sp. R77987 TaxID=3093874 RepID=UPI00367093A1
MIRRGFRRNKAIEEVESKGFDAFDLRLGDLMRGERATMGKSLLDVQRELKIKAAYIAAIENADPTAFDTPGFIAGYVRSYARYLNMDPDWAFDTFCGESGFATAHGMSADASSVKPTREDRLNRAEKDIFAAPATPFIPAGEAMFSRIEPGAIGSVLVLVALIGGLGYGGYSVLQEVQRVQLAPVENAPVVIAEVDPLAGAGGDEGPSIAAPMDQVADIALPSADALDRLYRPQALDVPVMESRDAPIASLDPSSIGTFADVDSETLVAGADPRDIGPEGVVTAGVQVTEEAAPGVQLVAVRPAWVRVRAADGTVIFESIMNAGDTYDVPQTEDPATLRIGESGAVYFAMNGTHYGPVGPRGSVSSNVALSVDSLTETYAVADISADNDLATVVNVAQVQIAQ